MTSVYLTVKDDSMVPPTVDKVLRYGPKHPVLQSFNEEHFLADIDLLLEDCGKPDVPSEVVNKLNSLTIGTL